MSTMTIKPKAYSDPLSAAEAERYASALRALLRALDREVVFAALVGDREGDLLNAERDEVERFREFLDGRVLVSLESFELRGRGLALLDAFERECAAACEVHDGVPSVGGLGVGAPAADDASVGAASGEGNTLRTSPDASSEAAS
ncbi:hypothetical protein AB0N64_06250 [Microbacterium sp. NPDC089318]